MKRIALAFALALFACAGTCAESPFPKRIVLVVPASPGGGLDAIAPRKTPEDIVAKIEKGVLTAAGDKAARQAVEALGGEPVFGSQREFAAIFRDEETFLASLIKQFPLE